MSKKGRAFRQHFGNPAADCLRTRRVSANCDRCGQREELMHMPTRQPGLYCPACCPCCGGEQPHPPEAAA